MAGNPYWGDSYYTWAFVADSGDSYGGYMFDDTGVWAPGQVIDLTYGFYYIGEEYAYGFDLEPYYGLPEGSVYTTWYYDQYQGNLTPYYTWANAGPSTYSGLGTEYDWAWDYTTWNDFGFAGSYQSGYWG